LPIYARELASVVLMARDHVKGKNQPARPPAARAPCVLVIDDNPVFLRSLVRLLQVYGIEVATARDGREGLATFRRISPTVVLTDIDMPVQNGIRTLTAMRRERPGVKIIAMSGGAHKSDFLTMVKKLGADSAVEKPFDVGELVATIRQYLKSDV
jgi:DNA-binding response OmpR family regulator